MANWSRNSSLPLLFFFLVSWTAVAASSDGPFIIAHKKATTTRLKSGSERVSVTIDLYNEGSATAYDLSLNDDTWPKNIFDIVTGNTSMSWDRLDVGGALSHSFELEAKAKTLFYGVPAVITFRVPTKAALQEAYSTPILPLDLLAERPTEKKFDLAKRLLAKYGSLVSVISIVVLFIYLIATPSKSGAAKKKR
ncbi:PREDICTED: translocon-associated protein subunit beta [Ipomoea nil]|uniref:translocon-associated protein subunit beta n=1 Tax=Ipomoea nil TaxID=35883 RepID=UPI0009013277|nr:PREDICTED: translocon-associated protein subunit beta [Ipomoea nil]